MMNLMEQIQYKLLKNVIEYDRHEFVYSDGGSITLDWKWASDVYIGRKDTKPIVILIPGSGNDSGEIYMQN
jgi:predicted alpha/beta-fold hydrolase